MAQLYVSIDSVCESYLRNILEVLQKDHNGVWDDRFDRIFVEARETIISRYGEESRPKVTQQFREWRKANKKLTN